VHPTHPHPHSRTKHARSTSKRISGGTAPAPVGSSGHDGGGGSGSGGGGHSSGGGGSGNGGGASSGQQRRVIWLCVTSGCVAFSTAAVLAFPFFSEMMVRCPQ
jgi:hypothetical protein